MAMLGCLVSCEKEVTEEEQPAPNSVLKVVTRADDGLEVKYPVVVYVFDGEDCQAVKTLATADDALEIPLVEGSYTVCAVGGADATRYNLPTQENALETSVIALKDGMDYGDLMTARSNVTLAEGETNQLTLAMSRKVLQLRNIVIKKVPKSVTAVSVTISPIWTSLSVNGSYNIPTASHVVNLEETSSGTWENASQDYILPSSSDEGTSIQVKLTTDEGIKSYTYNYAEKLEANYQLDIEGTYAEAVGVTLTGTLTGVAWAGTKTIKFDFDESGAMASSDDNGDDGGDTPSGGGESAPAGAISVDAIPAANTAFMGCFVLTSTVAADGNSAELLLLSPNEKDNVLTGSETAEQRTSNVDGAIASCAVEGVSGWRLMTVAEANAIHSRITPNNAILIDNGQPKVDNDKCYVINNNGSITLFLMLFGVDKYSKYDRGSIVRPVATVTVVKN